MEEVQKNNCSDQASRLRSGSNSTARILMATHPNDSTVTTYR